MENNNALKLGSDNVPTMQHISRLLQKWKEKKYYYVILFPNPRDQILIFVERRWQICPIFFFNLIGLCPLDWKTNRNLFWRFSNNLHIYCIYSVYMSELCLNGSLFSNSGDLISFLLKMYEGRISDFD